MGLKDSNSTSHTGYLWWIRSCGQYNDFLSLAITTSLSRLDYLPWWSVVGVKIYNSQEKVLLLPNLMFQEGYQRVLMQWFLYKNRYYWSSTSLSEEEAFLNLHIIDLEFRCNIKHSWANKIYVGRKKPRNWEYPFPRLCIRKYTSY